MRRAFKSTVLVSLSSLVRSRCKCVAALCSAGSKFGPDKISSKNCNDSSFSDPSPSKSCTESIKPGC